MYTVSLLAMLNARIDLRIQAERMGERPLPEIEVTVPQRLTNKKSSQATAVGVIVAGVHQTNSKPNLEPI